MAVGTARKKKGLFGSYNSTQQPAEPQMQPGLGMADTQMRKGPNWGALAANVVGNVGDGLAEWGGMAPVFGPQQQQQQFLMARAAELAERQRQQAAMQSQRAADARGLAEYRAELAANQPPKPGSFEWYQGASPQDQALYDQYNPTIVSTGQGPVAVSRSELAGSQRPMPGAIQDGYMFRGGDPSDQRNWDPIPDQRSHNTESQRRFNEAMGY